MINLNKYPIERKYIPIRNNTRPGHRLVSGEPLFFVAHDTGNPGATAENHYNFFRTWTGESRSAQVFIDDEKILEIIPTGTSADPAEKAWHVIYNVTVDNHIFGDDANDVAIGTELCWGGAIDFHEAYDRFVWYHAYQCHRFNKDPRRYVVGHEFLDPARKIDPSNALNRYGVTFDQFIQDVVRELQGEEEAEMEELMKRIEALEAKQSMPVPSWARAAVDAAVAAKIVDTPDGGSFDFYRIITVMHRKGLF